MGELKIELKSFMYVCSSMTRSFLITHGWGGSHTRFLLLVFSPLRRL